MEGKLREIIWLALDLHSQLRAFGSLQNESADPAVLPKPLNQRDAGFFRSDGCSLGLVVASGAAAAILTRWPP